MRRKIKLSLKRLFVKYRKFLMRATNCCFNSKHKSTPCPVKLTNLNPQLISELAALRIISRAYRLRWSRCPPVWSRSESKRKN